MIFDVNTHLVIIDTIETMDEAQAFIKFLDYEVDRHKREKAKVNALSDFYISAEARHQDDIEKSEELIKIIQKRINEGRYK